MGIFTVLLTIFEFFCEGGRGCLERRCIYINHEPEPVDHLFLPNRILWFQLDMAGLGPLAARLSL